MPVFAGKRFVDRAVVVDGNHYQDCTFLRCKIIYTAADAVTFDGCTFNSCDWVFDDAAERTLVYLAALYEGLGDGGKPLIELIFDSIRSGELTRRFTLPARVPA